MRMVITDDIGDTLEMNQKDMNDMVMNDGSIQDLFYPCECGNIVLYPVDNASCKTCATNKH